MGRVIVGKSQNSLAERTLESLYSALVDYQCRHGGNSPEMIAMSYEAFVLFRSRYIKYSRNLTMFGIPVHVTDEQGVKIRLCEPSIHEYSTCPSTAIRMEVDHDTD